MKIAIQGHPTRGKEVIKILESLGGINSYNHSGNNPACYYEIHGNTIICAFTKSNSYKYYILDEFEEEFPFKVGDIVQTKTYGEPAEVIKLYPNPACIIAYKVRYKSGVEMQYCPENIKFYKEMKEKRNITLTLDKAKEWYKKGGELKEIALQAFTEKELNPLPRSWEEFCNNYMIDDSEAYFDTCCTVYSADMTCRNSLYDKNICPSRKSAEAHLALIQLEQLRDCYRGLFVTVIGMPVWCIRRWKGELVLDQRVWGTNETFLSFQSKEVAEEYLNNFRPLIEKAEDLI